MKRALVIGAGPTGALLALLLARRGYHVDVREARPDPRRQAGPIYRSVSITLGERGLQALDALELGESARALGIPAHGRIMHGFRGEEHYQPYGLDGQHLHCVSRHELNRLLLDRCAGLPTIALHFDEECLGVDLDAPSAAFRNRSTSEVTTVTGNVLFGTDGTASALRRELEHTPGFTWSRTNSELAYVELALPAAALAPVLAQGFLHVWPRHSFFLLGLPNADASFTAMIFAPLHGDLSLRALRGRAEALDFFRTYFPELALVAPDLAADFLATKPLLLGGTSCFPWTWEGKAALVGDAAHTVLPFLAQGTSAAFEDCLALDRLADELRDDWGVVFRAYETRQESSVRALARLSAAHFDKLARWPEPRDVRRQRIEERLHREDPLHLAPPYARIAFSTIPFDLCERLARAHEALVTELLAIDGVEARWQEPAVQAILAAARRSAGALLAERGAAQRPLAAVS